MEYNTDFYVYRRLNVGIVSRAPSTVAGQNMRLTPDQLSFRTGDSWSWSLCRCSVCSWMSGRSRDTNIRSVSASLLLKPGWPIETQLHCVWESRSYCSALLSLSHCQTTNCRKRLNIYLLRHQSRDITSFFGTIWSNRNVKWLKLPKQAPNQKHLKLRPLKFLWWKRPLIGFSILNPTPPDPLQTSSDPTRLSSPFKLLQKKTWIFLIKCYFSFPACLRLYSRQRSAAFYFVFYCYSTCA